LAPHIQCIATKRGVLDDQETSRATTNSNNNNKTHQREKGS